MIFLLTVFLTNMAKYIETYRYDDPVQNYERVLNTLINLQTHSQTHRESRFYKQHIYHIHAYKQAFGLFIIDNETPLFLSNMNMVKSLIYKIIEFYNAHNYFDMYDYYKLNMYIINIIDYNEEIINFTDMFTTLKI